MVNCHNCINWVDESLARIEKEGGQHHVFMGCRIFGYLQDTELVSCPHYVESENLFSICEICRIAVPKVCLSLGECVNCTDTDLFCVDHCKGGDSRKYCSHFVRLHTQGVQLIDSNNHVFDLFPVLGMPGRKKADSEELESEPKTGTEADS